MASKPIGIGVLALSLAVAPAAMHEISGARIRAHVRFLASDLLEGRGVGTRGGQLAEEYLAAQFASAGLKPAGEGGTYFQTVPLVGVETSASSELSAVHGTTVVPLAWQSEFVGASQRQNAEESFEGDVVFAGHGISAPESGWTDFKKVDVKGKILLLFTNEPQPENPDVFKGRALTYYGRWTYKFEEALRQGALGALIIHTTPTAGYGWDVVRNSWSKEDPQVKVEPGSPALALTGWVTREAGQRLFDLAGKKVDEMLKAADSPDFQPIPLGFRLRGNLRAKLRPIESRNVAAIVPGSDTRMSGEYVVFTAHWDHLGIATPVEGDRIYNGAIDNATGCGILLETARAWAALEQKPRRSALFLSVTAEESGLRGSEYYSRHPLVPPGKTALNLNYDALFPSARTETIVVSGAERTTAWPIVQEAARRYNLQIEPDPRPEQGSYYRSDHFMLARAGVPAFSIRTGSRILGQPGQAAADLFAEYNSRRYHQPADEFSPEWDFASIEQAARFGMLIGINAANIERLPTWNANDEFLPARSASLGR